MDRLATNVAIILAGGKGVRFNCDIPKQFVAIEDKPVIAHTLLKFEQCQDIDQIIVVCIEDYISDVKEISSTFNVDKLSAVIRGEHTA